MQSLTVSGHVLVRMEIYLDAVSTVNRNATANDLDRISILSIRNGIFLIFSTNERDIVHRLSKAESSKFLIFSLLLLSRLSKSLAIQSIRGYRAVILDVGSVHI